VHAATSRSIRHDDRGLTRSLSAHRAAHSRASSAGSNACDFAGTAARSVLTVQVRNLDWLS